MDSDPPLPPRKGLRSQGAPTTKRKQEVLLPQANHVPGDGHPPPSPRQDSPPRKHHQANKYRQKNKHHHHQQQKQRPSSEAHKPEPTNALRAQIRSVTRFLARDLPADTRQAKERELHHLYERLAGVLRRREGRTTLQRYHMVRFFERQHATRRLKRMGRERDGQPDGAVAPPQLLGRIAVAEIDLDYAVYAPLEDVYVSLTPRDRAAKHEKGSKAEKTRRDPLEDLPLETAVEEVLAAARAMRPALWQVVERARREGKLQQVRDGTHAELRGLGLGVQVALERTLEKVKIGEGPGGGAAAAADKTTTDGMDVDEMGAPEKEAGREVDAGGFFVF